MPPSPWIGSIMSAAVSGPMAASRASRSSNGTWSKPSTFGPKPSRYLSWPPAAMVASVRPWKAPSNVTMRKRSGWPFAAWYLRAILMAASFASAPELEKKTTSAKVLLDQPLGQPLAFRDLEEVRGVPDLAGLLGERLRRGADGHGPGH